MRLPDDLVAFFEAGRQLEYDGALAEPGRLLLKAADELSLGELYVSSADEGHAPGDRDEADQDDDPHGGDEGYYVVPAADLVAVASGYDPDFLITWIPDLGRFGTWDSSHLELYVFSAAAWGDIVADPLTYVNAQWAEDQPAGYYVAPWLHGYEWREGNPW